MLDCQGQIDAKQTPSCRPVDDYVFAGLVTIVVTLLAIGVTDVLAYSKHWPDHDIITELLTEKNPAAAGF